METPTSTTLRRGGRRAAAAVLAIATALPLTGTSAPTAAAAAPVAAPLADPGDSEKFQQLSNQIEKLEKEYGGDLAKLKDTRFAVTEAMKKARDLEKDLVKARYVVARLAANRYMTGGEDPTVQFLAASDQTDMLSSASLITHLAQNKAGKVEQIQKLIEEQNQARKKAEEKISALEKEIKELKGRQSEIKQLVKKYKPESPSTGMGGVTPRMLKVKNTIDVETGPFPTIGCVRYGGDPQDHATGHACDFMVTTGGAMASGSSKTQGDQAAEYAIANASALGIKYVIWRQRIYDMRSPGWRMMENRGGATANHYDHVHISVF
ncbi:coiled-coil domain-containing protein [Actinomadura sp. LOL_016]|uniref:coiled-coil domain-containing protein n=1 Tax=Actinomadura sp. LOL_016 TaxID=3345411 RepID=UPI003A835990